MPVRRTRRPQRFLLVCVLALLLASGLAACNGSADDEPPPAATETAPQTAGVAAEPALAPPAPPAETPPPPITPPEAPVPEPPAEPAAPGEPSPPAAEIPAPVPAPRSFRYDTYDRSGAVAELGHYAFLTDPADPASVVTTYEGLRDGTATALRIHTADAHGVPQADLYDAVEAGDLVEWKRAADCFVRYTVTSAPTPAAGATARSFGVAWMTYAFTGCSGPIAGDLAATFEWGDLPNLGGTSLATPVIHGATQIVPAGWTGALEEPDLRDDPSGPPSLVSTMDLATARTLPYWREPRLPADWTLNWAEGGLGSIRAPVFGYCARYSSARGYHAVEICGYYVRDALVHPQQAAQYSGQGVIETRVVSGRPVVVKYSPEGPNHVRTSSINAWIYDPPTKTGYWLSGTDLSLTGSNVDAVLAILRSLFESPTRVLFYDILDPAGGVGEPGHYAFLADPGDPSSAVTTYEGLRDGTATALRIHTADTHGVPQADLYDAVEAGDLVEWRQADDCFVRYQVTAVPDPAADAVIRELGVAWMTYAFTGCSGPIAGDTVATFEWGDLPDLGGTSLTAPIIHGDLYQLVPEGWTGVTEEPRMVDPSETLLAKLDAEAQLPVATTEADAAKYTYWRQATVPPGWSFYKAFINWTGAGGLQAIYLNSNGHINLEIDMIPPTGRRFPETAASRPSGDDARLFVKEARVIAGRPAMVHYSPLGPGHDDDAGIYVQIYDPSTGGHYRLYTRSRLLRGANFDAMIALARSLFEPPNPP